MKNAVTYHLVRHDLFDKTVDAKRTRWKGSKETTGAVWLWIEKKNQASKIWVNKGTSFPEECEKLCKVVGILIYSTMIETKAAFAERTIRSLKI